MEKENIIKLITNQLNPDEKKEVLEGIMDSPENREEYYRLKNLWALTTQSKSGLKTERTDLEKFSEAIRVKKFENYRARIKVIIRYAAIIVIALFAGKFLFKNKITPLESATLYNEINVPSGQMAQLTLSDSTVVFINSCSKLKYPAVFKSDERKVFLSGEAYFSVSKNKTPFYVETYNRVVKVLGTKFNIMAYPNDIYYQATLVEGKVVLFDTTGNELVSLKPGEQYFLDIMHNKANLKSVKTSLYDSWKDGLYVFDHETLEEIAKRLERIYALKISIKSEPIKKYKFTGTISRNTPVEQILKIIQISAPIKYKLKKNNGAIEQVILY